MIIPRTAFACVIVFLCASAFAVDPPLKHESFDRDPGWEAFNNHVTPK